MKFVSSLAVTATVFSSLTELAYALPQDAAGLHALERRAPPLALDQRPQPKTPPSSIRKLNFKDHTCDERQKKRITAAFKEALQVIESVVDDRALSAKSTSYVTFLDANSDARRFEGVIKNFYNMKLDITDESRTLDITCKADDGCRSNTLAYASEKQHSVNFCPHFFSDEKKLEILGGKFKIPLPSWFPSSSKNPPSFDKFECLKTKDKNVESLTFDFSKANFQADRIDPLSLMDVHTVVHELSHLWTSPASPNHGVDDCYYGAYASEYMAKALPDAAVSNADSYAWFAMMHRVITFCTGREDINPAFRQRTNTNKDWFKFQWKEFNDNKALFASLNQMTKKLDDQLGELRVESNKIAALPDSDKARKQLENITKNIRAVMDDKMRTKEQLDKLTKEINGDVKFKMQICDTKTDSFSEIERVMRGN